VNRRRQIVRHQQQRIQQHAKNSNAHVFFKFLADPELLQRVESVMPKHRQRLFPPTETLSMFLAQAMNADRSCQKAVNDFSIKRCCDGLSPSSVYTGAYCKARVRLPGQQLDEVGALHRSRLLADRQQRGRAGHPALRYRAQELAVQRHAQRRDRQRSTLQPGRDGQSQRPRALCVAAPRT